MSWVKLDDKFWANPKVLELGNEGAGAYVRLLAYCGDHLTDGRVPLETAHFIAKPKLLKRLCERGFIRSTAAGFEIPDFLEFNPSKSEIEAKRARDRARKAAKP